MNTMPNYGFRTERSNSLFELIKSNLYLTIAVLMSVNLGLSFISITFTKDSTPSIGGLVLSVLTLIGVWLLRSGAQKGFRTSPFGFLKVRTISLIVILIIVLVSMLILIAFSDLIIDFFNAISAGSGDIIVRGQKYVMDQSTRDTINEAIEKLKDIYPNAVSVISEYGRTIIIIISIAVIVISILALIAAFKANGVINKMKNTMMFGYDEPINTGYLTAILYVFAGLLAIFTVISFFSGRYNIYTVLNQISNLTEAGLMVCAAMFYGKVSEIMK